MGETGTGKTTVCQRLAHQLDRTLHIVNCNQHTEAADLLGGYRPARCVLENRCTSESLLHRRWPAWVTSWTMMPSLQTKIEVAGISKSAFPW